MQAFKYFTLEGEVYTKKPQKLLIISLATFLFFIVLLMFIYGAKTTGNKVIAGMILLLGILLLFRTSGKLQFNKSARSIIYKPFFFSNERSYSFDDFSNFLISKQTMLITVNATAAVILSVNGKRKSIMFHQTMFITRPLQLATEEAADIMGLPKSE